MNWFFFHLKDGCEEADTLALASGGKAISGPDNPTLSNTNTSKNTNTNKSKPKIQIQIQVRINKKTIRIQIQILARGGKAISGADNPTIQLRK